MRTRRSRRRVVALLLTTTACTGGGTGPSAGPTAPSATISASPTVEPTTFLADGTPLPENCALGGPTRAQTVTFVAGGHVWAIDPEGTAPTCIVDGVGDPGPFQWGPRADRLLLGGLRIAGFRTAPSYEGATASPVATAWGHPVGIAVVYTEDGVPTPEKFFLEEGRTERLRDLPHASYLDVVYHPSGLALAFIVQRGDQQAIWMSTNEGKNASRLVFSREGTRFTDLAFTSDGTALVWAAQHAEGYAQIHTLQLNDLQTVLDDWKGRGETVDRLFLAPHGRATAVTLGETCDTQVAAFLAGERSRKVLLPEVDGPTHVVGWLDDETVLVAAGGCGNPMDLFAAPALGGSPTPIVTGVDAAATRIVAPEAAPPPDVELPAGSGNA